MSNELGRPTKDPGQTRLGPGESSGRPGVCQRRTRSGPGTCQNDYNSLWVGRVEASPTAIITIGWGSGVVSANYFLQNPPNPNGYYSLWGVFANFFANTLLMGICFFLFFAKKCKKILHFSSVIASTFPLHFITTKTTPLHLSPALQALFLSASSLSLYKSSL